MKLSLLTGAMTLALATVALAQQTAPQPPLPVTVSKTDQDVRAAVILFGRACRASDDQTWVDTCSAALQQVTLEAEAVKAAREKVADEAKRKAEAVSKPVEKCQTEERTVDGDCKVGLMPFASPKPAP